MKNLWPSFFNYVDCAMKKMETTWTTEALRAGDQRAFEALYRYYYRGLCAFGAQYITLSEAEEVVQDTMMWLWEHREAIDETLSIKTLLLSLQSSHTEIPHQAITVNNNIPLWIPTNL